MDERVQVSHGTRETRPLFEAHEKPLHQRIYDVPEHLKKALTDSQERVKKAVDDGKLPSNQGVWWGLKLPPFDIRTIKSFQSTNVHHETCVLAKVAAICGLGFRSPTDKLSPSAPELGTPVTGPSAGNPVAAPQPGQGGPTGMPATVAQEQDAVSKKLDPLCDISILDVLTVAVEDFVQVGNGYIECVRGNTRPAVSYPGSPTIKSRAGEILGLYPILAEDISIVVENAQYDKHYQIITQESAGMRWFAQFGDLDGFRQRVGSGTLTAIGLTPPGGDEPVSEVIHLRQSTSLNRWYGWPTWIAGTVAIELTQCLYQHNYDFFLNRGVPEFLLLLMGKMLEKKDWDKIEKVMHQNIGLGNSSKSAALNLPDELTVKLEKLALEGKTDGGFAELHDPLALDIVSAHRVPHLLAGIQIPGKLGAANELPNALMAFQVLVCGPAQAMIQKILGRTLGNSDLNGGLGLTEKDFTFREIIDRIDVGQMDTIARMRQPVAQAQAQGRDPADGLLKEHNTMTEVLVKEQRAMGLTHEEAVANVLQLYAVALESAKKRRVA